MQSTSNALRLQSSLKDCWGGGSTSMTNLPYCLIIFGVWRQQENSPKDANKDQIS